MSIFFSDDARPFCKFCRCDLSSRGSSGRCPGCNRWYAVARAEVAPSRTRAVALAHKSRHFIESAEGRSAMGGIAMVLLLVGNAAIVVLMGRMALKALYHACEMKW